MKTKRSWLKYFVGAAVAGLLVVPGQSFLAQDSSAPTTQTQQNEQKPHTFMGKIENSNGELVLAGGYASRDPKDKATYKLDDQEKAKPFEGKNVRVRGTLNASTNTIHVTSIRSGS